MTEEALGTGVIYITADATKMEAGITAAQGKMSQFGAQAEAEYNKASASSKRYATSLLNQAEMLGKTRAEQIAYNAQVKVGGELGKQIAEKALAQQAAMQAMAGATTRASHAIHEFSLNNSFARRELGRLVSDIAKGNYGRFEQTSLTLANASGLLGKVFSKTGAAAIGMAVGVGLLFKALVDSENETAAFNKALLVTGNIANTTVPKMQALAGAIARNGATHGEAFDAVQKAAATGRFIGDQFELVATAAARMEDATGQSVDDTVRKFEEISQDPVKALLKLNETEHFLTQAQLDRVQALVDEGKQQDAVTEGARIYATRLGEVADAADAARPHLARMWSDAKHELSDVVEGTKNFTEFLAAAADKYKQMPWYERGSFGAVGYLHSLFSAEPVVPTTPKPVANTVNSDAAEAARNAREALAKFASPTDQLKAAEDEAKKKFLAAIYGISDPATIAKYKAEMEREVEDAKQAIARAQHKDKVGSPHASTANAGASALASFQQYVNGQNPTSLSVQGDAALTKYVQDMAKLTEEFDKAIAKGADAGKATAAYWADAADETRKYTDAVSAQKSREQAADAAYAAQLQDQLDTRKQAIALQVNSIGMGKKEIEQYRELNEIYQQFDRKLAQLNKERDAGSISLDQYNKRLADLRASESETIDAVTNGFRAADAARASWQNGLHAALQDFIDEENDVAGQTQQFTTDFISGFGDAFASFASGAESAKDAFGSFIDDMERQALKALANKAIQELLMSFGGSSFGASGSAQDSAIASAADSFISGIGYAKGGAFGPSGEITAFANGGVVSNPTLFKFANGIGLMAENEPEAIMPLKRMASGRMGVETTGGNGASRRPAVTVNQTIVVGSLVDRRTREQLAQETARRQRIATARNS